MRLNKEWHEANRMPPNATLDQRVRWHVEHARVRGCRPIPPSVLRLIKKT